jgi:superfamily II DNA or RNA helicase
MNQIVQRVGRVLRKAEGKETALVYVIYVSDSKDDNILECVKNAIDTAAGESAATPRDKASTV